MPHSEISGNGRGLPAEIGVLLHASDEHARGEAWDRFVHRYSRLLLHTVHARSNGYDDAMDRYAFVLEALRENDFRRFRAFDPGNRARFSTWLVVVAGRLCIDYHRKRYGTVSEPADADWRLDFRRRLADLIPAKTDVFRLEDPRPGDPELAIRSAELRGGLLEAVAGLGGRDRMLLRLRFFDGLSAREIAEVMDFPSLFHVYRRLNKVLRGLRTTMEAEGFRNGDP